MSDDEKIEEKDLNFIQDDIVYIHGYFDETIETNIIPQLKALIKKQKKLKDSKIVFDICSAGGYVYVLYELLALIELAKSEGIIIETRAMSTAHSCAALLLMSGSKGHRYASPFSFVLIHHATQYMNSSTDNQLDREYFKNKSQNETLKSLVQKYSKIPTAELKKMLNDDSYTVYGENLIKFGIVDKLAFEI